MRRDRSLARFALALLLATPIAIVGMSQGEATSVQPVATPLSEARQLRVECRGQVRDRNFNSALQTCQRALDMAQRSDSFEDQVYVLDQFIEIYSSQDKFAKVIEYAQTQLEVGKKNQDKSIVYTAYTTLFFAYRKLANYAKAVDVVEQLLNLNLKQRDGSRVYNAVRSLQSIYTVLGDEVTAKEMKQMGIRVYQEDLVRARMRHDFKQEMILLRNLGTLYKSFQELTKATEYYKQGLQIARRNNDLLREVGFLELLTNVYVELGNVAKFVEFHNQQSQAELKLMRREDKPEIAARYEQSLRIQFLDSLTYIYAKQGDFAKAETYFEQVSKIRLEQGRRPQAIADLSQIYYHLGSQHAALNTDAKVTKPDYSRAIKYYEQALKLLQDNKLLKHSGYFYISAALGDVYKAKKDYSTAAKNYQNSLNSVKYSDNSMGLVPQESVAFVLKQLAETLIELGEYAKAIECSQEQLVIARQFDVRIRGDWSSGEIDSGGYIIERDALQNMGSAHQKAGNIEKAIEAYQSLLSLSQEKLDRDGQVRALNSIASLLMKQDKPELTIVFYKQSVNVTETIRQEIRQLQRRTQEAYTKAVAETYRRLADLLLSQERILEAQQVLELLKVQELKDFDQTTRARITNGKIELDPTERIIVEKYGSYIAFGQKLRECQDREIHCTEAEQDRLRKLRTDANQEYAQAVKSFEAAIKVREQEDKDNFLNPNNDLSREAQKIIDAQPGTALIYSLITDNKLWLVLATKGEALRQFEVTLPQEKLNGAVLKFRQLMEQCEQRPCTATDKTALNAVSQQLYTWLFPQPLQQELQRGKIKHLVFAQDRMTRYLPMAALFDGKQYLIENFTVSTIVSAKFTNIDRPNFTPQTTSVLATGLSNSAPPNFRALSNVPVELAAIVRDKSAGTTGIFPGLQLLNEKFDFFSLQKHLYGHTILHIATHGAFVRDQADASYILLGTGRKLPISEIKTLNDLGKIHLVILSACQTALADRNANGVEIANVSYSFLDKGVKSVIASLWQVSDSSTSLLMREFYSRLAKGNISKAEALQQVQIEFLKSKLATEEAPPRSDIPVTVETGTRAAKERSSDLSHPYYWAPFILIGNSQ